GSTPRPAVDSRRGDAVRTGAVEEVGRDQDAAGEAVTKNEKRTSRAMQGGSGTPDPPFFRFLVFRFSFGASAPKTHQRQLRRRFRVRFGELEPAQALRSP